MGGGVGAGGGLNSSCYARFMETLDSVLVEPEYVSFLFITFILSLTLSQEIKQTQGSPTNNNFPAAWPKCQV